MTSIICWDIGGANIKASKFRKTSQSLKYCQSQNTYFAFWQNIEEFEKHLLEIASSLEHADIMLVTITAELSDVFPSKAQGIRFIAETMCHLFKEQKIYFLDNNCQYQEFDQVTNNPPKFCASNWLATAQYVALTDIDCLIVDIGSTTTDIIPIENHKIRASGRTDLERLQEGELLYTGALRTNPNTIVSQVPVYGKQTPVAAEYFCTTADVNFLLNKISVQEYTVATADGKAKTKSASLNRLAKLVCCDNQELGEANILQIAQYIYQKQVQGIADSISRINSRFSQALPLLPLGFGSFLVPDIATSLGLKIIDADLLFPGETKIFATTYALAHLFNRKDDMNW